MKKNMFSVGMVGIFLTFIFIFSSCVSSYYLGLGEVFWCTLTITDIPAEYEGGFVDGPSVAKDWVISNGSISIEVSTRTAYDNSSKTGLVFDRLEFNVIKVDRPIIGIRFESVTFENKTATATVKWADGLLMEPVL